MRVYCVNDLCYYNALYSSFISYEYNDTLYKTNQSFVF